MQRIVLTNGTFLTGDDLTPVAGALAVSDGTIEDCGPHVQARPGDHVVDLDGGFAMPGLMDAHCHLVYRDVADPYDIELRKSVPQATVDAVHNAALLLRKGFTTIRDVGSRANIGVEVRDAIRRGDVPGPRVLAAGRIVSAPGGLGDFQPSHLFEHAPYPHSLAVQVVGPYEAAAVVRTQLKDGVDWIKVGVSGTGFNPLCPAERSGLTDVEFHALVDEAVRQGVPVVAHAESADSVRTAARAGVASIEHALFLEDDALAAIVEHGLTISPTLSMYRAFAERGLEMGIPQVIVDQHRRTHEHHVASIAKATAAGVPIVAGGDAGLTHFVQGSCAVEPATYVELVGMSPRAALQSITVNIARLLGIDGEVGTLAPGMAADVLVLRRDPLADVTALADDAARALVLQGGVVVS
ncbi:amidohydrolase family protein [Pseudonocardia benzenivorans]|jgi:imidazolonepropionase-like amidohydrolase|uniref:Amidohydrolase n=2 Tax=Pseudonocardia TaxID=1847 RepID=F4D1V2_PSEUX|nr:amidohydrolase family protein [Pseudonocardia dioxanivorans]AEA28012.1 amidohydrolase [Pseudonocardia dioxanivorans CB1190]GJF06295.1 Xaa-Pro dipeptidase [Pseudonocardia sp. D17]